MTLSRNQQVTFFRLGFLFLFLPTILAAQTPQRIIEKASWRTEPIKIQQVKTNGKIVELGKKFEQDEDWLKGLSVSVENVSNKAIARIEINLSFPRSESASSETAIYVTTLMHGLEPSDVPAGETPKLLLPGESVDVRLIETNVPLIKQDLISLGYPKRNLACSPDGQCGHLF